MLNSARDVWLRALQESLEERRQSALFRFLRNMESASGPEITLNGRRCVQFCSNNYLGLATHPEVIAAARTATERFGTGAGASRLVAGSLAVHHELETAIAAFERTEAALVFPTGFMANLAVLTTFAGENDTIVSDKLNHASLLDAAKFSGARHRTFPHRHYARAAELLGRAAAQNQAPEQSEQSEAGKSEAGRSGQKFLVSDSVFSMDGDLADLPALCDVAESTGALVIIDEAHGAGVLGEHGSGLAELQGVKDRITLTIGTLSKALGSLGGFVAGPRAAIDTLINSARPFIYTTALPPGCTAAALASLQLIQNDPSPRRRVLQLANHLRRELTALGFNCGDSASPIIPVILGSAESAMQAAAFLEERGLFVPAIRPPTVAPNTARLRISLMATHSDAHLEQLLDAMRELPGNGLI